MPIKSLTATKPGPLKQVGQARNTYREHTSNFAKAVSKCKKIAFASTQLLSPKKIAFNLPKKIVLCKSTLTKSRILFSSDFKKINSTLKTKSLENPPLKSTTPDKAKEAPCKGKYPHFNADLRESDPLTPSVISKPDSTSLYWDDFSSYNLQAPDGFPRTQRVHLTWDDF
ncbi:hypothetical protein [Microbulbifer sp. JMSA003]|uniref:hypothetical protein n=1 Tax=Microbulbifer sp. JMSA003 TaxID=3243369 RepID=UPI004039AC9B